MFELFDGIPRMEAHIAQYEYELEEEITLG
jgi:hypothetical protein